MTLFQIIALLLTLTAVFAYVNHHVFGLPSTIGVMLIALLMSLGLLALNYAGLNLEQPAQTILDRIDFNETVLHGLLGFLLFAGALHVDLEALWLQKWTVLLLATIGVLLSTFLIGGMLWGVVQFLDLPVSLIGCLLFGALISPTDPIAVLGILRKLGIPKRLEVKITGEALFNDGISIVVFIVLLEITTTDQAVSAGHVGLLFLKEVGGGLLLGLVLGALTYLMLKSVDNYQVEILLSLALVSGGYALADRLGLSAPIQSVVAGLLIGNVGRRHAMSDHTREHLDTFWELIDEILNAVLFGLIGFEVMVISFDLSYLLAGLGAILIVLIARFVSLGMIIFALRAVRDFSPHAVKILTWGGLRGSISVALALSLPSGEARDILVTATYVVVLFSILVQALTLNPFIRWIGRSG